MIVYPATGNAHKVAELAALLKPAGIRVGTLPSLGLSAMPDVDESADSFDGNALLKAQALLPWLSEGEFALADDSGLEVECLDGAPGVWSARYAGPNATDADNRKKLLSVLRAVPEPQRGARFRCCLALISPELGPFFFMGTVTGTLLAEERGTDGFGYDPLFVPLGYTQSFAELGSAVKDGISHRARAVQSLLNWYSNKRE